jgi:hypothetical protein
MGILKGDVVMIEDNNPYKVPKTEWMISKYGFKEYKILEDKYLY